MVLLPAVKNAEERIIADIAVFKDYVHDAF